MLRLKKIVPVPPMTDDRPFMFSVHMETEAEGSERVAYQAGGISFTVPAEGTVYIPVVTVGASALDSYAALARAILTATGRAWRDPQLDMQPRDWRRRLAEWMVKPGEAPLADGTPDDPERN